LGCGDLWESRQEGKWGLGDLVEAGTWGGSFRFGYVWGSMELRVLGLGDLQGGKS
jgi:hypothetical protein